MILGLGIDICPVERMRDIRLRHGDVFIDRVFTGAERAHAGEGKKVTDERFAARWAAKEASIKALGAPEGLRWHDMEVRNSPDGAPELSFQGAARERADALGVTRISMSISHAAGVAVAVVILEGDDR